MRKNLLAGTLAVVALAVIGAAVYLRWPAGDQDNAITGDARAEQARALLGNLEKDGAAGYEEAYKRAQAFQESGHLADAQLLYFYAARGGHAPSAFALATMNDPNHHSSESSLLPEPDPFQAYKWYSAALAHGSKPAAARLEELHAWAKEAAANGNSEAERLLLQWQ